VSADPQPVLQRLSTWPPAPGRSLLAWWSVTIIAVAGAGLAGFGLGAVFYLHRDPEAAISIMQVSGWTAAAVCGIGALFAVRLLRRNARLLEDNARQFRTIADAAPAMIWTTSPDGKCDYCNRAWFEFMGGTVRGRLGDAWAAAIHPEDLEACRDSYAVALAEHRDYRAEFRLRRHDGVYRWVMSFGAPRQDSTGKFGGYIGMCVDITEQREAARAVESALARFDRAVAATENGIWEWDLLTSAAYVSPRLREMTGAEDAPVGDAIAAFRAAVEPSDFERCMPIAERAIRERTGYTIEFRLRIGPRSERAGQVRWFRASGRGTYDATGRPRSVTGSMTDITEDRERETLLREAVDQYEALAKLAPVGIFRTGPEGACQYVNNRWSSMSGLTQEQAAGDGWVRAVHPEDREDTRREWYESVGQGDESYHEHRFLRQDGSIVWVVARSHALLDERERVTGYLGTCTDVTAIKEAEAKLRHALHSQEAAAAREHLLRRELDHRVRNNLSSLLGLIRLSEQSSMDRRSIINHLRMAVRTMNDSHELISRAHGESVLLDQLLRQMLRAVSGARESGRIAVFGPEVRVGPERVNALAMALQELVTNSVKYGALSGTADRVEISWSEQSDRSGRVRLVWREVCSPIAASPIEGFGLSLVKTLVAIDLEGTAQFEFGESTMTCTMEFRPRADHTPSQATISGAYK
jgi:PAS domain S-box-containing protein